MESTISKKMSEKISLASWQILVRNWKLFLPALVVSWALGLLVVGASEDVMIVIGVLSGIMIWLTSIYFTRQILAGKKVKTRDGFFNAMTPLLSTLIILVIIVIQFVPIMLCIIAAEAAVKTALFDDFFAGSLFVLFTIAMIALTLYLITSTLMALVAVSAPGMYPVRALTLTREIMKGEKGGFAVRLFIMLIVLIAVWLVIVGIGILIELLLRNLGTTNIPAMQASMYVAASVSSMYSAVYLYMYYRKGLNQLDFSFEKEKSSKRKL